MFNSYTLDECIDCRIHSVHTHKKAGLATGHTSLVGVIMSYVHGITREDIFTAADEVFAAGKNPTQASIRAKLGRGSFSTISKYLAEWKKQHSEESEVLDRDETIPEDIQGLLRRFYGAVRANVESGAISEQVQVLEAENDRLRQQQENYEAITAELAGLRYAYQEALEKLDQLARNNERLTQELEKTKTRKPRTPKRNTVSTA